MGEEQKFLDISKSIDVAIQTNLNEKELKKLNNNNITSNFKRILIYTSLLCLLQFFVTVLTMFILTFITKINLTFPLFPANIVREYVYS